MNIGLVATIHHPSQAPGTEAWLQKLGSLPWMAQPGELWMYHVSADVLGVLIARVSGQSLGTFMRERIFDPLGMKDTAFHVPSEKIERLPGCYFFNRQTNTLDLYDDVANSACRPEPPFESGQLTFVPPRAYSQTAPRRVIDPSGANIMSHQPPKQEKKKPQLTPKEKKVIKQQKKHVGDAVPLVRR